MADPTSSAERGERVLQVAKRSGLAYLDFEKGRRKDGGTETTASSSGGYTWPAVSDGPRMAMIRSHSSGRLKFSPEMVYDFTSDDLDDLGEIGQGAFGAVSKMVHRKTGTVMAVKRIRSTMDQAEERRLLMDLNVIMTSDECPYIVTFYGAIFKEGDCWICMELMDTSLEKLYRNVYQMLKEELPEELIGKVTLATLKALSYLKDKHKIIHRDIKPSNILVDRKGHIKLCDFGIAGQLVDSIAKTRDAGCRPYMAPERIDPLKGKRGYDVRSDVWSLGITLVEIATGKFPYPDWNSVFDQLDEVVNGDPPLLTPSDHPRFSLDFINFVNSCLTKDETQRPKYKQLLEQKFIKRSDGPFDVAKYVSRVLDLSPAPRSHAFTNGPVSYYPA